MSLNKGHEVGWDRGVTDAGIGLGETHDELTVRTDHGATDLHPLRTQIDVAAPL